MSKYKKQVQEMLDANDDLFKKFKEIHDKYAEDPIKWQTTLNEEGKDVMMVIQRWENNLCSKSESGRYGKFSTNLSEKFWTEVRALFPKIGYVGMKYNK
jgi:hypothetical protein